MSGDLETLRSIAHALVRAARRAREIKGEILARVTAELAAEPEWSPRRGRLLHDEWSARQRYLRACEAEDAAERQVRRVERAVCELEATA